LMIALFRVLLEAHVESEQRAVLLSHEMKHRASNLLGMVQAISAQTARNASTVAEYQSLFSSRLAALAQAQQLFAENPGLPPNLRQVLQRILEPFGAARFRIDGPDVEVPKYLLTCCALLFHELATNATKYGALSSPDGIVMVKWDTQKGRVHLEWQERNGPPVVAPMRTGFGSRLLKTAFPPQYGEAAILFNSNGVCCTVSFALRD
jgi:two-component sensor histidine kinase